MIKTVCFATVGLLVFAGAAQAAPVCLRTQDMISTAPQKDGATIQFTMRDGSVWRNDLHGRCPDLWFNTGFVWSVKNGDGTVCENEDTLHVLKSAEVCTLGKFTQITPSRAEQHAER